MVNQQSTNYPLWREYQSPKMNMIKVIIYVMIITLMVLITFLLIEIYELDVSPYIRYISFIPTLLVAFIFGTRASLLFASFFTLIYIPELYQNVQIFWFSTESNQLLTFIILIYVSAFITAEVGYSMHQRIALSTTVDEWRELLGRATDFDELVRFVLLQSKEIVQVEQAFLLLQNPLSTRWEIVTDQERISLPIKSNYHEGFMNFSDWLLEWDNKVFFNFLDYRSPFIRYKNDDDPSFIQLRSFLSIPLRHQDGILFGVLVLINKFEDEFSITDFDLLRDLIQGSERALEQAGLYARTDYSLARRVRQLAAIQRTARELNTTLDSKEILERTLKCALEITDGEAGLIRLDIDGDSPVVVMDNNHYGRNTDVRTITTNSSTNINPEPQDTIPELLPVVNSRLICPIRREEHELGYILVESSSHKIFKDDSKHVLAILADHAANALENASLFHEIELEQQRVSTIFNTLEDGLITTDMDGIIITTNQAVEKLIGIPSSQLTNHSCCKIFCDHPDSDFRCQIMDSIVNKESVSDLKFNFIKPDTGMRFFSLAMTPMTASKGHPDGAVFLFRDVTDNEEMERLQKELIAAISHELRAPLSNISTIAETLLSDVAESKTQPITRYLTHLMSQTKRLADFSDRILDIYQLETGQRHLQLRPAPIYLLVERIVNHWRSIASHNIQLNFKEEKSPWVWVDENGFETVLNNLIENAVKYSPKNTKIIVTVEKSENSYVTCSVQDQGPGIEPEFHDKIFRRFYRIDGGDSQKVYGHGLGLYLCRNLVELMGGNIWIDSESENGSLFAFTVPMMEEKDDR
jgi:PAS domain S-box-containing protein